jgi:EamA domain-containing membrane protein RarD
VIWISIIWGAVAAIFVVAVVRHWRKARKIRDTYIRLKPTKRQK